jgi:hypothetical protein
MGVGSVMKLRDYVVRYCLIELRCGECHTHTALDPAFFLARRGDIESSELAKDMVCPACGSMDIALHPVSPVQAVTEPEDIVSARRLQRSEAQA